MKKRYILLTAMVVLYGVCAGILYSACNSEEAGDYGLVILSSSISEERVPIGVSNTIDVSATVSGDASFFSTQTTGYSLVYKYTLDGAEVASGGSGYGVEFSNSVEIIESEAGTNILTLLAVDSAHTNDECKVTEDYPVVVVKIISAEVDGTNVICYQNTATIKGTPYPEPSFPSGNAVWSNLSGNGPADLVTGATTTYSPSTPSATNNDIEIKGECGTSSASAFITAVGVTGMTFTVVGAGADTPADTLGIGEEGTATAFGSPAGRALDWFWAPEVLLPGNPPFDITLTPSGDTRSAAVKVEPGSGSGTIRIVAVDSDTGCGWYKIITIGCGGCSAGLCPAFGSAAIEVHSVSVRFSLGSGYRGSSAGFLHINTAEMSPELFSPSVDSLPPSAGPVHSEDCLAHEEGPGSHSTASADFLTSSGDDKLLRQIKVPDGLVDIVVSNEFRYDMVFYPQSAVGPTDQDGFYQPTGAPSVTYIIENPDASTNIFNRLRITKVIGSDTNVSEYVNTVDGGTNTWQLATGNGLKTESVTEFSDGTYTNILRTVTGTSNEVVSAVLTKSMQFPWGLARVEQVTDPDGVALSTSWSYYTNSADAGRYSRLAMQVSPDGSWQKHDYTEQGYPLSTVSSYLDASTNATAAEARATYYDYTPHAGETPGYRPSTARTVIETTLGVTNSITYRAFTTNGNGEREEITERAFNAGASYGDTNNLRTVTTYYAATAAKYSADKLKSVRTPDGRLTTYTYENGIYEPNADPAQCSFTAGGTNEYLRTTVTHGTVASPDGIAGQTTREVTIVDPMGGQLMSETYVYTGTGYDRINWRVQILDATRRPATVHHSDGTRTDTTWGCCGKDSETDTTELETDYSYDALDRMDITTRQVGTNSITTSYVYDAAGRRLKTTVSAGGLIQVTSNAYNTAGHLIQSVDAQGITTTYGQGCCGLESTTIRAGVTNLTVRYADGRTHYTQQNNIRQQTYTYGLDLSSPGHQTTTIYTGPEATNSPAWQKTTTDLLGRTVKTERPGYNGATLITENTYNPLGQLIHTESSTASGVHAATLYQYNPLGEQTLTAQDINTNGVIDLAGPDRVSSNATEFVQINGDWYRESRSYTFPETNSATALLTSTQRQRLTGLGTPLVVPPSGGSPLLVSETISIDLHGNQTVQQTAIDRENAVRVGLVSTPTSTNNQTQITINGLLTEQTSSTGQTTTHTYDALGRRITTSSGDINVAPFRQTGQTTHYNTKGQVEWVEDAATNRTTFAYDPATGRRIATTDALTNTTHQAYSAEGQLIATWGATYPVYYEYDAFDRMSAMYTYRGTNTIESISDFNSLLSDFDKTSWFYDPATGLLTNKLYAADENGIRNGTAYTYTPDGKLATRTWARGITTTYAYDTCCGSLTNITYSDNTPSVSYNYDRLGRQTSARTGEASLALFAYDPATLALTNETIIANGTTNIITRTQDPLGRASGITLGADYTVTYGYDNTGRFASLQSSVSGLQSNLFSYTYLPDSSLISGWNNGTLSTVRSYEPNRNLLTDIENMAGTNLISRFAYENDAIGRRTTRIDTHPFVVPPSGGSSTNTFGYNIRSEVVAALMGGNDYGYKYDPIGNREQASLNAVTNFYAANALNQYTNISNGTVVEPTYDDDGNMVSYNGWTFTWNGENRLITASNATTVVENAYDYMGRRIQKVVNGVTNTFLYDGWAMIRESKVQGLESNVSYYVYGIDLSGSMQGAGTIGGILSADLNGTTAFYCYDANGNVTDLVDTNGNSVAHYEYGPFGGTITQTGSLADDNPFRFSTKYLDGEVNLYYYGYRYYSPELGRWPSRDPIQESAFRRQYQRGKTKEEKKQLRALEGRPCYIFAGNMGPSGVDFLGLFKMLCAMSNVKQGDMITNPDGTQEVAPLISGHAVIALVNAQTVNSASWTAVTYGLWPDFNESIVADGMPNGAASDIRVNYFRDNPSAYKYKHCRCITASMEQALQQLVSQNVTWQYLHNCASFASDTFHAVTSIDIDADDTFGIETPREFGTHIYEMNGGLDSNELNAPSAPAPGGGTTTSF